jgi:RNA polymerase sigma factor (sigma-70 family)
MPSNRVSEVIQHLGRALLLHEETLTDAQLLEAYVHGREEAALGAIVRRHAPMVWGVCCRILCDPHDAEDAFQATFLVLVRRARAIASRELLANWLYGVARQTARKARATAARRREREMPVSRMPEPAVREGLGSDLRPVLDEEMGRLPSKYRVVIVLCDLEGKSRKEAAQLLGCPEGTVGGRLSRARAMLAKRLARRGLAVPAGALAAVLAEKAAGSTLASLVSSTIQAAATGVVSGRVAALTEGVLKAMLLRKLTMITAVVLVALAFGMGGLGISLFNRLMLAAQGEQGTNPPRRQAAREADAAKTDQERLQGTWEFVSAASGELTITKQQLKKKDASWKTATFTGDKVRFVNVNTGGKEVEFRHRFKLDSTRKPKTIDLMAADGGDKGETVLGLYEIEGDLLKLCVWDQLPRPRAFDAKEEVLRKYLITYKRAGK